MPMYEYECKSCGARFDLLRGMHQSDEGITCAVCSSPQVQRLLSLFASFSKDSSGSATTLSDTGGGCSGSCCGGGACSLN